VSVASKNKIAFRLLALVFFMLAMSFAAVPFYDWFCRVTGFGGVTQTAVDESDKILERNITVRFDGSLDSNIDWEFKPTQRKMTLRIGETGLAFYEAHNPTDKVIAVLLALMSILTLRDIILIRYSVFALKCRSYNQAKLFKCL